MEQPLNLANPNPDDLMQLGTGVHQTLLQMMTIKENLPFVKQLRHDLVTFEYRGEKKTWVRADINLYFDAMDFDKENSTHTALLPETRFNASIELLTTMGIDVIKVCEEHDIDPYVCEKITEVLMVATQNILKTING